VIIPDHVVMSEHTEAYEWGPFPFPIDVPWLSRSPCSRRRGRDLARDSPPGS
jgi:hypothetical protein